MSERIRGDAKQGFMWAQSFQSWGAYLDSMWEVPGSVSWGDAGWAGVENLDGARALALNGWPEGMQVVKRLALPALDRLSGEIGHGADLVADVTGAAFDVGAYLSGEPECWIQPEAITVKPVVSILANISASAGVPSSILEARGAAVVGLALALQGAGYAVRVSSCMGCAVTDDPRGAFTRVTLTDESGGPLDADRLVYALAHPSALRSLAFVANTQASGRKPTGGEYLAAPEDPPAALGWDADLYLPRIHFSDASWKDAASVQKWIADMYARLTAGSREIPRG